MQANEDNENEDDALEGLGSWSNRIRTQAHQYTQREQFLIPIWLKEENTGS